MLLPFGNGRLEFLHRARRVRPSAVHPACETASLFATQCVHGQNVSMRSVSGSASERWKAMRFKTRYLVGAMAMMLPATAMAQSEMAQNQGFYVQGGLGADWGMEDRKSTRLNSSH